MPRTKKLATVLLQTLILLIGVSVFAFMLCEPHYEGRNANATLTQVYFDDPFLAYAYIGSVPFYVAIYHAFKALGYAGHDRRLAVKSLRIIKYCAIALIGFAILGEVFILINTSDDRAGGVFMGALVILGSIVIAATAAVLERQDS